MNARLVLGKIFRISNLGTLIFFCLNVMLIFSIFGNSENVYMLIILYFLTVVISLSPLGESIICIFAGAENIKRTDIKIHIIPLVEVVLTAAKEKSNYNLDKVIVKIIHDKKPSAFALGRHTIAVTDGLLLLPDEMVMSIIAHEVGHLAYGHTTIQLLIGGGNFFISIFLMLIKTVCWVFTAIMSITSLAMRSWLMGIITALLSALSFGSMWLWVKFCKLFLMWSMRQNEFKADEYAAKIGFGYNLALALDSQICGVPHNGFLQALFSSHPDNDERIAALQNHGVYYSRY